MIYRRKPYEVELRKNQYRSHLKKLHEITKSDNLLHRNLLKERQQIDAMMRNSHQLHSNSMKLEFRRREQTQIETQRSNYEHVRSYIKQQFHRKQLTIPQRHKPDNYLIDLANIKLVDKIVHAKSQLNFRKDLSSKLQCLSLRKKHIASRQDELVLNKQSDEARRQNEIALKIRKSRENLKFRLKFLDKQPLLANQTDSLYFILLNSNGKKKKSINYKLDKIVSSDLFLDIPSMNCSICIYQKIGNKNILKFTTQFKQDDFSQETTHISRYISDCEGKSVSLVQIFWDKKQDQNNLQRIDNKINEEKESELIKHEINS